MIKENDSILLPEKEFVALMAAMMGLVALSIDSVLPALDQIEESLAIQSGNSSHLVITFLFLGLAIGQTFFGTLSDYLGRKPAVAIGIVVFLVGCIISFTSTNLSIMLVGRLCQGIGLSGPRVICVALVRDQYRGVAMARIMSIIMSLLIIMPALAPLLGQGVLLIASWHYIFVFSMAIGAIVLVWFWLRQPETLNVDQRQPFSLSSLAKLVKEVVSIRVSLGYTIIGGLVSGGFLGFLSSIQPIFGRFGKSDSFALGFAVIAIFIGCSYIINSKLVKKYPIDKIVLAALVSLCTVCTLYLLLNAVLTFDFWVTMSFFLASSFCIGILFGNINALAMEPLGHIAGLGSSVVGSLSTFIAVPIGMAIGFLYDDTVYPLMASYLILSGISVGVWYWIKAEE